MTKRPLRCKVCGRSFARPGSLQGHVLRHRQEREFRAFQEAVKNSRK